MAVADANITARLAERAVRHPDRLAIADSSSRLTFGELYEQVTRVGGALRQAGVGPGDRVLVFVPMSTELYVVLLGVLHAGAVAVFVDAWANRRRLEAAVRAASPKAFIGSRKAQLLRLLSGAVRRIPLAFTPRRLLGSDAAALPATAVAPAAPALVTFTTGTTGAPKAAERTHGFLVAQHEALAAHLHLTEADVDMPTLPVFVLNNLATGVASVIPDADPRRPAEIDPRRVYGQILTEGVTTSSGSPAFYERLAEWCEMSDRQLPLRAVFTGGAPVLPPLAARLRDVVKGTAHIVYGSTEAEPISGITAGAMVDAANDGEGVCVGVPVAQVKLKLIRPTDEPIALGAAGWVEWEVAAGDAGEIVVAGDHVLRGYIGDPEAERRNKIRDGDIVWHRTGDAARLDREGRIWLLGRVRERHVRDGRTWWPLPAEVRSLAVKGIAHAAYVAMPASMGEPKAVLCVEGDPADAERLTREATAAVAPWPVDEVRVLQRIPRDPRHASKTDLETLRAMLKRKTGR
ncbi:MAG: AMP-binding protein [Gemmatimonadaceae bacterium]|nr:AMP-binding protein [Gemmatimonadaceae bacterium]